jgi:uncharacterized protein (UPF0212 family)
MAWKAESKRHSIAKKYGRASSKKAAICSLHSSQVDSLSNLDFSKAPDGILEQIILDKTASKGAQDKAFDELVNREHSEHSWTTIEQARQIVNDHLAKVKLKVLEELKVAQSFGTELDTLENLEKRKRVLWYRMNDLQESWNVAKEDEDEVLAKSITKRMKDLQPQIDYVEKTINDTRAKHSAEFVRDTAFLRSGENR